jgi:hypothetical protein
MKWNLIIITMMATLLIPLTHGVDIQYSLDNITWRNLTYMNEDTNEGYQINLQPATLYYLRGRYKQGYDWNYTTQRTKAGGESIMASLGILLFVNALAIGVFWVAAKIKFTSNEVANFIIKRCLILIGLFFVTLNTTIAVTISDTFGLGVEDIIFTYLFLINWTIYVVMVVLFLTTLSQARKLAMQNVAQRRMGQ